MRAANSHFGKHYINGVWTTPKGAMIDVENPATREIFARVPDGTPEEVDAAVAAAQSAFPRWSSTPLAQRIALMEGMLRRFCEKTEAVIELEVAELGAPVAFARSKHCLYQQKRTAAFIAAARSIAAEEAFPASLVMRRCRRCHYAVELPFGADHSEGCSGAAYGLHGCAQAERMDAAYRRFAH